MTGMKVIMLINETKVTTMKTIAGSKQHGQIFHILLVSLTVGWVIKLQLAVHDDSIKLLQSMTPN